MDNEYESEVPQALELLELTALDNAKDRILKNGDVPIVKGRGVSRIQGADKLQGLFRAISEMRQNPWKNGIKV